MSLDAGRVAYEALREALLALHRPTYVSGGRLYEHTVMIAGDEVPKDHICRVGIDACHPPDEHYVPACSECRVFGDESDLTYYQLWPCATARLVMDEQGGAVDPSKAGEKAAHAQPEPWCPECFEAPEPDGPWAAPGDRCADEHVLPWLEAEALRGNERGIGTVTP